MELSGLIEDLRDRLRPIRSQMFPQQVLLQLQDDSVRGQGLANASPEPLSIQAPLPALTCRGGMPLEREPLGDLIGDLLVDDGRIEPYVLASLPSKAVQWRVIVWPFEEWPEDPAEALRQIDPQLNLGYPLAEAYLDLQPLPGQPRQMLLAAAQRKLVDGWIEVFSLAGAKLDRLAPTQNCLFAAIQPQLQATPADQLVVLLAPEPDAVELLLLRAGIPVFERQLPLEEEALLRELKRCLDFYRRQDTAVRSLRVLLAEPMDLEPRLPVELGVTPEVLDPRPFATLVLQGLATQEVTP